MGRVGVEGFVVFSLRVVVSPLALNADNVAPLWDAVDAIYTTIIRSHHRIVVEIESPFRISIFIHGQQPQVSRDEGPTFVVNHAPRYHSAANKRDVNGVARFALVERNRSEDLRRG